MRACRIAVLCLGALLLAACGAEEHAGLPADPAAELELLERRGDGPLYWLGRSFEGLPLTRAESAPPAVPGPTLTRSERPLPRPAPARSTLLVYGHCNGEGEGDSYHCAGPQLQLQQWPLASPSRYPRGHSCTRTTIRGVPAAQFDHLEVYVGRTLLTISAPRAQARRAAAALRQLDGGAAPPQPLPQPALDLSAALRRCALDSLDAKLEELREHARIPLLWAGRRVEGRPLFRAEGDGTWARFAYGHCDAPEVAGSCWPAVTVEVEPSSERRPARWARGMPCRRTTVRGAPAATMPGASAVFVFTGAVTVHLHGRDPGLVRRAAETLQPLDGKASGQLAPPATEIAAELRARCSP